MHEDVKAELTAKYNDKVRNIAKKLANKEIDTQMAAGKTIKLDLTEAGLNKRIGKHLKGAKAMVAEMAICYIDGYMSNCDENEQEGIDRWLYNARHEAMELGLLLPE